MSFDTLKEDYKQQCRRVKQCHPVNASSVWLLLIYKTKITLTSAHITDVSDVLQRL